MSFRSDRLTHALVATSTTPRSTRKYLEELAAMPRPEQLTEVLYAEAKRALHNHDVALAAQLLEQCPDTYKHTAKYRKQCVVFRSMHEAGIVVPGMYDLLRRLLPAADAADVHRYAKEMHRRSYAVADVETATSGRMRRMLADLSVKTEDRARLLAYADDRTSLSERVWCTLHDAVAACVAPSKEVWDPYAPSLYMLPRAFVLASKGLMRMQSLRPHLVRRRFDLRAAFAEGIDDSLFVSHRWEDVEEPDAQGAQLAALQAYLRDHPEVEWVWYDYACMPQGHDRTEAERAEFVRMLSCITYLYLTARVLILLDNSYVGRFWTLMEAWCAMQTTSSHGVRPASLAESRFAVVCLHNADSTRDPAKLVDLVATKMPSEMRGILAAPDVCVTNARDKTTMLAVVGEADRFVRSAFA